MNKKIITIILMFLTLIVGAYAEETSTSYEQITSELYSPSTYTSNTVIDLDATGIIYTEGYFQRIQLTAAPGTSTGTIEIYNDASQTNLIASKAYSCSGTCAYDFTPDDYSVLLKAGDAYTININQATGSLYYLNNGVFSGTHFTITLDTNNVVGTNDAQYLYATVHELTTTYPATYNNITTIDFTNNMNLDSNFFEYLFTGNTSVYPTRNDGTLSGYTFNDGTLTNGVLQHDEIVGSLENGVVWNETRGLTFDGVDDYVDTGITSTQITNKDFTLCINGKSDYTASYNSVIGFTSDWYFSHTDNQPRLYLKYSDSTIETLYFNSISNDNEWHQICAIYNGTDFIGYFDGTLDISVSADDKEIIDSAFNIGKVLGSSYFSGTLNDITILNKALNSSQVLELYNTGKTNYEDIEHLEGYEWRFDEESGTETIGRTINGKFGKSLEFDGVDDYVGNVYGNNISDVTISAWINTNALTRQKIYNQGTSALHFRLQETSLRLIGYIEANGGYIGSSSIPQNTWTYVTMTYTSSTGLIESYINGVWDGSNNIGTGIYTNSLISGDLGEGNYMNGSMDEVRIWDTALNSTEILLEMDSSNPIKSDSLVASYSFEEHAGTTTADTNHIVEGAENGEKGMAFDGVDDVVISSLFNDNSDITTLSLWIKPNSLSTQTLIMKKAVTGVSDNYLDYNVLFGSGGDISVRIGTGSSNQLKACGLSDPIVIDTWQHITIVLNEQTMTCYNDGINVGGDTFTITPTNQNSPIVLGVHYSSTPSQDSQFDGMMDDVRIYNTSLSSTDVSNLYAGTYADTTNLVAHYTFEEMQNTAIHDRNNQLCVNCQVTKESKTLAEGTYTQWYLDELTDNTNEAFFMIDLTNPSLTDSLSVEYNDGYTINLSNYITATDSLSGVSSCIVDFSTGQQTNCNNESFVIAYNGNITYSILLTDNSGNTNSSSGTVYFNPNQYFYFYDTDGSNTITNYTLEAYSDVAGLITIPIYDLGLGSQSLEFNKLGYPVTTITPTFTTTSSINLTINITPSKIIISIFDRDTGNILTGNTDITLVATTGATDSTTTGYLNMSDILFIQEEYQLIAEHTGYATESVYFDFTNQETLNVNIYMINNTATDYGTITLKAITSTGALISSATCSALEWKPISSSFISVAQGNTNINGEVTLNIEIGTKLYKFSCTKSSVTAISDPQIIGTTGTTLPIILTTTTDELITDLEGFSYSFTNTTYNSSHQRFTYTFADENNLVNEGCIKSYKVKGTQKELLDGTCAITSIGEVQTIIGINNTYTLVVEAWAIINSSSQTIETKVYKANNDISVQLTKFNLHILIPLLFSLIGMALGYSIRPKNIYLGIIGSVIGVWIGIAIVPSVLSVEIASFITVIGMLMVWGGYTRK